MTRFREFTDDELKALDNALSFAISERELVYDEVKDLQYELSGEEMARRGWEPGPK